MSLRYARYAVPIIVVSLATAGVAYLRGAEASPPLTGTSEFSASVPKCVHTEPSEWDCPDTTRRFRSASEISSASVSVTTTSGETKRLDLPSGTDAVFLTRSAINNFLLPYYGRTNQQKQRQLRARLQTTMVCRHYEPSEWDCPDTSRFNFRSLRIAAVNVTITSTQGQTHTSAMPWGTDAIFLTKDAVERFLLNYYTRTRQTTRAGRLRDHIAGW
jgi:hypothetical protein